MPRPHLVEDEPMAEINLVPLIDIALTLLIIMMLTTAFVRHPGVSLRLPNSVTREGAPETSRDLTIAVSRDAALVVDGRQRGGDEVQAYLRQVAAVNPNARILIKGDRDVAYSRIMDVLDMVRQAGLTRIVLPTQPRSAIPELPAVPPAVPTVAPPPAASVTDEPTRPIRRRHRRAVEPDPEAGTTAGEPAPVVPKPVAPPTGDPPSGDTGEP